MIRRLRGALPGWRLALVGSTAWAVCMAASAAVSLWLDDRFGAPSLPAIVTLFAIGGFVAFTPAMTIAGLFGSKRRETRFAAIFLALTIMTVGITALLYALHFRFYFAQWHADPFTVQWAFEFGFTVAAALYQFAVLGLRLYFPLGLAALFAVSLWFANRSR